MIAMMRFSVALAVLLCAAFVRAERIVLRHGDASCTVDTHGGRIVSYSVGGEELLWQPSDYGNTNAWHHGGIPICWPWFGRIGNGDSDIHGFAWNGTFTSRKRSQDELQLVLNTGSMAIEYEIAIKPELRLTARTVNCSQYPVAVGFGFHPYFKIGDIDKISIEGLTDEMLSVKGAVDKTFDFKKVEKRKEFVVHDKLLKRDLHIVAENSSKVNLWNPGKEKECPGFIPGEEWRKFVAVEPMIMGVNRFIALKPGEKFPLSMTFFVRNQR